MNDQQHALDYAWYYDDASAADGFRNGDRGAFEWLASRYLAQASNLVRGILQNAADAEDLAQEAFVRAWTHRRHLIRGRAFAPWFFRIVRNIAIDYLRRRKRFPDEALDVRRPASREEEPDVVANGRFVARRIRVAFGELPPQQRRVASLFFIEGCPHAEIAREMSLAEGTVRAHLSFARKRLRVALSEVAD